MKKWWLIFGFVAFLSMDFWNWEEDGTFLSFLPYWAWRIFLLTLFLAIIFEIFAKYEWREEK